MFIDDHCPAWLRAELDELRSALERCWDEQTSAGGYTPERPSTGQCAVTAMIVQDRFGGDLMRVINEGDSHYYNRIDGVDVDLTRDQFNTWAPTDGPVVRDRDYVGTHPSTKARYELLAARHGLVH